MNKFVWIGAMVITAALGCGAGGWNDSLSEDPGFNSNSNSPPGSNSNNPGGGNISLGGAQDFGYFRSLVESGIVPTTDDFDASGFFAEHHWPLPVPDCGEQVCLQAMLGVMASFLDESPMSMLQIGLNTAVTIDPDERPPLNLSVVVDVSGSMDQYGKMTYVREGLATLIQGLEDTDRMSLITYSNDAKVVVPMATLAETRTQLLTEAGLLRAGGSTNFYDGLELGYQQAAEHYDAEVQNRVLMLSDGQPTTGVIPEHHILSMSAGYNADGLGITTIGLGNEFNYGLMRDLAQQGHGNFYFLEDSGAIDEVFTEELAYFTLPVAFDVVIEATAGAPYQFERAFGSTLWESDETGGRVEVPSVFLAHRVSDDDTTPGGGRRGGGSALLLEFSPLEPLVEPDASDAVVASLDVSYRAPGSDERVTQQVEVRYPHPANELEDDGYFSGGDPSVAEKSFVVLNMYRAIEEACSAYHSGDSARAAAALSSVLNLAGAYNESPAGGDGDEDLAADLLLIADLRDLIAL